MATSPKTPEPTEAPNSFFDDPELLSPSESSGYSEEEKQEMRDRDNDFWENATEEDIREIFGDPKPDPWDNDVV